MTHSNVYKNKCYFLYMKDHGQSGDVFIINKNSDKTINLTMISDRRFSFKSKLDNVVSLKLYAVPIKHSLIETSEYLMKHRSNIHPIIKFDFNINNIVENRIVNKYDKYEVSFSAIKMKDDDYYYISNPMINIDPKYLN